MPVTLNPSLPGADGISHSLSPHLMTICVRITRLLNRNTTLRAHAARITRQVVSTPSTSPTTPRPPHSPDHGDNNKSDPRHQQKHRREQSERKHHPRPRPHRLHPIPTDRNKRPIFKTERPTPPKIVRELVLEREILRRCRSCRDRNRPHHRRSPRMQHDNLYPHSRDFRRALPGSKQLKKSMASISPDAHPTNHQRRHTKHHQRCGRPKMK